MPQTGCAACGQAETAPAWRPYAYYGGIAVLAAFLGYWFYINTRPEPGGGG